MLHSVEKLKIIGRVSLPRRDKKRQYRLRFIHGAFPEFGHLGVQYTATFGNRIGVSVCLIKMRLPLAPAGRPYRSGMHMDQLAG